MKALFYGKKNTIDTKSGARYIHIATLVILILHPKGKFILIRMLFRLQKKKGKKINL